MTDDIYERNDAHTELHDRYTLYPHQGSCFYCGDVDTTDDHVPPLKILYRLRGHDQHITPLLVRSCTRCNSSLGDIALMTPLERRDYIQRTGLPRQITTLRSELDALRLKHDDLVEELHHLLELHGVHTLITFSEVPVTFFFRLTGVNGLWEKTSERTYKGSGASYVANLNAEVEWWSPPKINPPSGLGSPHEDA